MSIQFAALDHQEAFKDVFGMSIEEKAQYLDGLLAGAMGVSPEKFHEGAGRAGASRGNQARERYEAAIQQKKDAGAKSAAARKQRTGSAIPNGAPNGVSNGVPNGVRNDVPNGVRNDVPNGVPNDASTPFRTREEKRRDVNPLTPQGEPGGDFEGTIQAIWDRVAVPRGFPVFGPWSDTRRRALEELLKVPWDQPFAVLWSRAVDAMAADDWARSERVNADYLLRPPRFRRHLDAWKPKTEAPRLVPRREPPPTPTEAQERAKNRMQLAESFPPHHSPVGVP